MNIVEELTQKTLELYPNKNVIKEKFGEEIRSCASNIVDFIVDNVKEQCDVDYYSADDDAIYNTEKEVYNDVELNINALDRVCTTNYPRNIIEKIRKNIINVMIKNSAKELGYGDEDCTKEVILEVENNLTSSLYPNNYYEEIMDWFYADISESGQLITV